MIGLDDAINLGAERRKPTTLRQLASEGRLVLRKSGSYRPAGSDEPRKALWVDIAHPTNPNATEGFEISAASYAELVDMGVAQVHPTPTARKDEEIVCPSGTVCGRVVQDVVGEITGNDFSALELDGAPGAERYICSCCGEPVAERRNGKWRLRLRRGWVP